MNRILTLLLLGTALVFGTSAWAVTTRVVDADSITSSDKTKTYSLPAATDTLVGRQSTDTLTGKSMSGASNTFTQLPVAAQYTRDPFTGTGAQTVFTLSQTPALSAMTYVYMDGLLLTQTTDYTLSGTSLTLLTAPELGQTLSVIYSRF